MASNIVLSGTKGISLPSFTTTEKNAIVSPATGAVVYDTTLNQESVYNGSAWVNVNTSGNSAITSGTAQASTSGTSIDFTGIPSWVKRITVMFNGVSTNGTSGVNIQLGYSGGIETTGYVNGNVYFSGAGLNGTSATNGFNIRNTSASDSLHGVFSAFLFSAATNTWACNGHFATSTASNNTLLTAGSKALTGTLDRVRITTVNGTDTFDAGSINILYE